VAQAKGRSMNEPKRWPLIIIVLIAVAAVLLVVQVAYANGSDRDHGHHDDGEAVIADIAGDDLRALALSQALGDAAISGCIVTTQWGIIIYQRQGYRYDVFCLADKLDQAGKFEDAAAMRCTHKIPTKLYGDRCLSVMNFEPPEKDETDKPVSQVPDDRYVQQQEELEFAREERASLVGQIEKITQQLERPPPAQQQVQQQIDEGAERRARSLKAYEEALAKGSEQ